MARCFRRRMGAHEQGAEAVEFALVLPVFVLLVFGVVDFGYVLNCDTMVNNASREGAREGAVNPNKAAILLKVSQSLAAGGLVGTTPPSVTCLKPDGSSCANVDFDTEAKPGGTVIVKMNYHHSWITPVGTTLKAGGITLSKTTQMRIE